MIAIFKAAAKFVLDEPAIILLPMIFSVILFLVSSLAAVTGLYIYSAGRFDLEATTLGHFHYKVEDKYTTMYFLFGFVWIYTFI